MFPAEHASKACSDIEAHVRSVVRLMTKRRPSKDLQEMLELDWQKTPQGWSGPKFGVVKLRGWQKGAGTGRTARDCPQTFLSVRLHRFSLRLLCTSASGGDGLLSGLGEDLRRLGHGFNPASTRGNPQDTEGLVRWPSADGTHSRCDQGRDEVCSPRTVALGFKCASSKFSV